MYSVGLRAPAPWTGRCPLFEPMRVGVDPAALPLFPPTSGSFPCKRSLLFFFGVSNELVLRRGEGRSFWKRLRVSFLSPPVVVDYTPHLFLFPLLLSSDTTQASALFMVQGVRYMVCVFFLRENPPYLAPFSPLLDLALPPPPPRRHLVTCPRRPLSFFPPLPLLQRL